MYELRILATAARDLENLDREIAARVAKRLRWLAENLDSIQLQALTDSLFGLYKLRVGDYRVFYQVLRKERMIVVHAVGHRREIYR